MQIAPRGGGRSRVLPTACFLALAATAPGAQSNPVLHEEGSTLPNVLVVLFDDLGVDFLQAYGAHPSAGHMPVVDGLARDGLVFRRAWSNPGCSPTRATLVTGRYSFRTGMGRALTYENYPWELDVAEPSIAKTLGEHYESAAIGKWHMASSVISGMHHPLFLGFDHHAGPAENILGPEDYDTYTKYVDGVPQPVQGYATTHQFDDALSFVEQAEKPWMVYLALNTPHGPLHAPPPELHEVPLGPEISQDPFSYNAAMLQAADTELGRFLESLPPGDRERTIVFVLGDNGTAHNVVEAPSIPHKSKGTLYEGGVHVPFVVTGPGVARGRYCDALVNTTDLHATLADLVNAELRGVEDSVSLTPYFEDPLLPSTREWVYAEQFFPFGDLPKERWKRAVRNLDGFKLIERFDSSIDPTGPYTWELYDLRADPYEWNDLLLAPVLPPLHAAAFQELQAILDTLQ